MQLRIFFFEFAEIFRVAPVVKSGHKHRNSGDSATASKVYG